MTEYIKKFTSELANIIKKDMENIDQDTQQEETVTEESVSYQDNIEVMGKTKEMEVAKFSTIDEYKEVTGKRFRLTKAEKESGMSREDAFNGRFGFVEITIIPEGNEDEATDPVE